MYQVEKNIPIPATVLEKKSRSPYPFDTMEVGDSIFIAGDENAQSNAVSAMRRYKKTAAEKTFVFGMTGDGVRIWRKE